MSLTDTVSAAGITALGQTSLPAHSDDVMAQQWQTARAKVNYDIGLERLRDGANLDSSKKIGGSNMERYDGRLSILKGDLLLIDVGKNDRGRNIPGLTVDARPTVFSSLMGETVPDYIQNDAQFQRLYRVVGVAPFDTLIDNAAKSSTVNYGTTIVTAGTIGSTPHVVPEPIGAGQLLYADLPRIDRVEREKWHARFQTNRTTYTPGCEKPVLRPWSPYVAIDTIGLAIEESIATNLDNQQQDQTASPAKFGIDGDAVDPCAHMGNNINKGLMGMIWQAVVLMQASGLVTINDGAPKSSSYNKIFDDVKQNNVENEFLFKRLGLANDDTDKDNALVGSILAATMQSFVTNSALADAVDLSEAFTGGDSARIQAESSTRLVKAITGAFYESVSMIVAKSVHNSKQGDALQYVISQ